MKCLAFVLALVACGTNHGTSGDDVPGDAPSIDGAVGTDADPDASPDAAGPTLRVEATSWGAPLAGVTVAFFDASDASLAVVTTGADGIATGPASASVVAASGDRAYYWRAIEANDVLHARFDAATPTHAVTFTLPTAQSASYRVATRCGRSMLGSSRTITVMLPTGCTSSDVIAQRYSAGWVQSIVVTAQSLANDTVDMTALAWSNNTSYSVVANGVTDNSVQLITGARVGEVFMPGELYSTSGQDPVGTAQTSGPALTATGAEVIVRIETQDGDLAQVFRGTPPVAAFDGASRVRSSFTPGYAAATHTVAWSFGGTGDAFDAVRGTLVFPTVTWEIVAPPLPADIHLPTLPPELASFDPGTAATTSRRMRGYTLPGGYDRARTAMFGTIEPDELLAQSGLMRMSDSAAP